MKQPQQLDWLIGVLETSIKNDNNGAMNLRWISCSLSSEDHLKEVV